MFEWIRKTFFLTEQEKWEKYLIKEQKDIERYKVKELIYTKARLKVECGYTDAELANVTTLDECRNLFMAKSGNPIIYIPILGEP